MGTLDMSSLIKKYQVLTCKPDVRIHRFVNILLAQVIDAHSDYPYFNTEFFEVEDSLTAVVARRATT